MGGASRDEAFDLSLKLKTENRNKYELPHEIMTLSWRQLNWN